MVKGNEDDDSVDYLGRRKCNDSLDGGAGTDTKTVDTIERSIVGFPWRCVYGNLGSASFLTRVGTVKGLP